MRAFLVSSAIGLALVFASSANAAHRYRVAVDPEHRWVDVQAQPEDPSGGLHARNGDPGKLAMLAGCADPGSSEQAVEPPVLRGGRIVLPPGVSCITYRYPLEQMARRGQADLRPRVMVSSPSSWLWLPEAPGTQTQVELVAPGMAVSVPWPRFEDGYRITDSPESSTSVAVFGEFNQRDINVAGGTLRVAFLDSAQARLDIDKTSRWLEITAGDITSVYGRMPNPQPQVLVWAVDGRGRSSGSPIPFGNVIRDTGESVQFFVRPDPPLTAYLADWTATHEFAHLLLPYVRSDQKWISEGFAGYYQNVLLARRGVYTHEQVWKRLLRSFAQAQAIRNPPSPNGTADRSFWEMRMLIYWSGAAVALHADTRLREMSAGAESLDSVLGRLQACCLPSRQVWSGEALFSKLDTLTEYPVFMDLYREFSDRNGMPSTDKLMDALGVKGDAETVLFDDDARLAWIRRALMATPDDAG
ncbi:MAG: hypothetical protein O3A63_06095 [Proteobacteria bacterium]|nr:hypothetical protein [Pseudomonadota bacterium]